MSGCIAAVVLAAGTSSRMAGRNKLLCEVDGVTLIEHALRAALASRCSHVVVATGWEAERVEAACTTVAGSRRVAFVRNPDYQAGLASSLRCAMARLPESVDAALVQLADMPWITAAHIDRLIATFEPGRPAIVVPMRADRRGHPVLWPRRYFPAIRELTGDVGARELLARYASDVRAVPFDTDAIFEDIDTPDQLGGAQGRPLASHLSSGPRVEGGS